jgi:hypothetical protein
LVTKEIFAYGDWWAFRQPFFHYRALNVLDPTAYNALSSVFFSILDATTFPGDAPYKLRKSGGQYDALVLAMNDSLAPEFAPLFSESWLRSLAGLFSLPFIGRVDGGLHSSPPNSRTGWVHTDLCSAWFDEANVSGRPIAFADHSTCDYFFGHKKRAEALPNEYVRAVTAIYYLCNDGWQKGDGGETALYSVAAPSPSSEVVLVPPENNSLLVFECTPHSYHRFVANPGRRRNSVILWLHTTVDEALTRWGAAIARRGNA